MFTLSKASRRAAAPLLFATGVLSLFALHCSSGDNGSTTTTGGTNGQPAAGAGGSGTTQGGSVSGGMSTGGSAAVAGSTSFGGTSTAGAAGTTATAGGGAGGASTGGSGGAGGASAGGTGGGGGSGGGGSSPLFEAVETQMAKSCGVGMCHNAGSGELNYQDVANLYKTLTSAVPANNKHCAGNGAVVVANDANSLLIEAIKAKGAACMNNGQNQTIGQMPDSCPDKRACLTADEIKIFTDWVAAGAPM